MTDTGYFSGMLELVGDLLNDESLRVLRIDGDAKIPESIRSGRNRQTGQHMNAPAAPRLQVHNQVR